jgi:hypothetical protein
MNILKKITEIVLVKWEQQQQIFWPLTRVVHLLKFSKHKFLKQNSFLF